MTSTTIRPSLTARSLRRVAATLALITALGTTLIALAGCVTVPPPAARVTVREVPAPRVETVPPPPASGYAWVPGHWAWRDGDWRWVRGHYVARAVPPMPPVIVEEITVSPSPAHVWVRGHWVWRETGWGWVRGTWVLR